MPNVSSVNLSRLQENKVGEMVASATALMNLAQFAKGPLRLQKKVENGETVIYLGVRSWSTYFFEKIIATPAQKTNAKLKTQKAINKHVRGFLNNSRLTFGPDPETLTANLQAKVVGKSVTPAAVAAVENDETGKSLTRPAYRSSEVIETTGKLFHGTGTVPTGLSVAAVAPLRIIADVRLVTEATFTKHPKADSRRGLTYKLSELPSIDKKTSIDKFKTYYLDNLKSFAGVVQTSVVMELQLDSDGSYSEANREGACAAAKEFVGLQKLQGKQASVMLTVPKLPSVNANSTATVVDISTRNISESNDVMVQDSNSENSEQDD